MIALEPGRHEAHHVCEVHGVIVDIVRNPHSFRWCATTRYFAQTHLATTYDLDAMVRALDTITLSDLAGKIDPEKA